MKRIFKYEIKDGTENLQIPKPGIFLTLQMQNNVPVMWFEVDDKQEKETRTFACFDTGETLPSNPMTYLGTYQRNGLVAHIYEIFMPTRK